MKQEERISWDEYFLAIAKNIAMRGTCDRKQVGYIVVKDKRVLTTGYNGSISGLEHCSKSGHMMVEGHCVRTIHAEINAIIQAAKHGINIDGATMYGTWGPPCWYCFKAVANAGIKKIVYIDSTDEAHDFSLCTSTAEKLGIELFQLKLATDEK